MKCPRCGAEMSGGICDSCGFPMNRKTVKKENNYCVIVAKSRVKR